MQLTIDFATTLVTGTGRTILPPTSIESYPREVPVITEANALPLSEPGARYGTVHAEGMARRRLHVVNDRVTYEWIEDGADVAELYPDWRATRDPDGSSVLRLAVLIIRPAS